jgi:hypothetical protein
MREGPNALKREYLKGANGERLAFYRYIPSSYEILNAKMAQS